MTLVTQTPGNDGPTGNRRPSHASRLLMAEIGVMMASGSAMLAPVPVHSSTPARAPASSPTSTNAPSASLIDQIDSFGFDTRMTMGVGGFLTLSVYPVVSTTSLTAVRNRDR